jgi:hypothetical protein
MAMREQLVRSDCSGEVAFSVNRPPLPPPWRGGFRRLLGTTPTADPVPAEVEAADPRPVEVDVADPGLRRPLRLLCTTLAA